MQPIYTVNCNTTTSMDCQPDIQSNIYIYMVERGGGTYHLPLLVKPQEEWVNRHTSEKKPEIEQVPNLLMPIRLLRLKPDGKTQPLRPGCWLYIFQDGYLWREICLPNEASNFPFQMDVNLSKQAGKNQRPAECVSTFDFALPYRVNDYCPEYRLAFSEIQWSWSQIQALGGMHPEDPRNLEEEDLQTATTLAALEQRTGLIPLTDADIKASQIHVLNGPSQPMPNAEFQLNDSEELTLPHLLISDPLQDARELKEKQDALIALQNAGLQSMQTGQLGLAQMIEELTTKGDPLALEEHLNPERYDQQLLDTWDSISEQLPERLEAAEEALLDCLQQEAFTLTISDYMQSDDLLVNELGLTFFTQLTQHLVMPESLDWLYERLSDEKASEHPVYKVARGEKEALNQQLVRRTAQGEEGLPTEDEERLLGLELPDRLALIGLLPATLDLLIGKYAEAASRRHGQQTGAFLDDLAKRFTQWTGTKLEKVTVPLRNWRGTVGQAIKNAYSYLPHNLTRALHLIGNQKVVQLIPKGKSFGDLIQDLDRSRTWQASSLGILGSLMLVNAGLALQKALSTNTRENDLAAAAASASVTAFIMDKSMKLTPQPLVREASSKALGNSTTNQRRTLISRFSINKLVHHASFTLLYRLLAIVAGVAEIGVGIWRAVRGFQTGNTGVMLGAGLETIGATLLLASTLIVFGVLAGPLFWIALLGATFFASGALLRIFSEYTPLEEIVRYGWFGSDPYNRFSRLPFNQPEAFDEHQNALDFYSKALGSLEQDSHYKMQDLLQPDLSEELTEITKTLFYFDAEIKVHELHESHLLPEGAPTPRPNHAIVELYVTLGAFSPVDTRFQGHIQLNGWQIPLHECYVIELREPSEREHNSAPQYLRFLTQVPRHAISRGIRATAWLDPDGSGQIQVPDTLPEYRWSYTNNVPFSFPPRNNLGSITESEWWRLKSLAVISPAGEPETGVLVDYPEGCQEQSRDQAVFNPLFATVLQGGH